MWVETTRLGSSYATVYRGSTDLSERIPGGIVTGTVTTTAGSAVVSGKNSFFRTELHIGQHLLFLGSTGVTREMLVVESIESDTEFIATTPAVNSFTDEYAVRMPIMFALGTKRGTALRGNAVQFPKGHILGVGAGTLRVNGEALNVWKASGDSLSLSKTPRFALYDPTTDVFTQIDVGIDLPARNGASSHITVAAVNQLTVNAVSTSAPTCLVTTSAAHGLSAGDFIDIGGVVGADNVNGEFTIITAPSTTTFRISADATAGWSSGGKIPAENQMRAGSYSIRIRGHNTETLGYSNPSDVLAPVTLTAGQAIKVTINMDMTDGINAWQAFGTEFYQWSTDTLAKAYMGPWYLTKTVTDDQVGRSAGTSFLLSYSDAEINATTNLLSFDNFAPKDAEFVDIINGIPIYMSCLGRGTATKKSGSSPGPAAIPSKPSNPEAVFLDKAITTAGGDTIVGSFNTKGRVFALCENSLQTVILTSLDFEPITFRSLWDAGFRNPYNVAFVKEYLYGYSTQNIIRSVAGGDDSSIEFSFASDVRDFTENWDTGQVLVAYDPKNRAVCFVVSGYEQRSSQWVTMILPFRLDSQTWNPPIIITKGSQDAFVSGVCTLGERMYILSGGAANTTAGAYLTVTGATNASPIEITTDSAHNLETGDIVVISGVGGNTNANGIWTVTKVDADQFTLDGSTGNGALSVEGRAVPVYFDTYEFDGGDSETKRWYLAWNFTDSGDDEVPKILKGISGTFRAANAIAEVHGVKVDGAIDLTTLEDGHGSADLTVSFSSTAGDLKRVRRKHLSWGNYSLWTIRLSGSTTGTSDRVDEIVVAFDDNSSKT